MGKIIGESFKPYVKGQIEVRQEKLGQLTSQDNDYYTWVTNRQPWIRLCSSINISENKRKELGLGEEYKGSNLAKNYILYGGVAGLNEAGEISTLKGGISNSLDKNNLNNPKAYGFNSSAEFGLEPLPSITNINVVPKNRGSLTEATIKIYCHNVDQFNIIETLFLRLKYSILLEWGFNVYYNNDGELITTPTDTVYRNFLGGKYNGNKGKLLKKIEEERKSSCGNYDGFYGWVTNFNWSLTEHGGYDVEINAITLGDVIESVKVSTSPPQPQLTNEESGWGANFLNGEEKTRRNSILANIIAAFVKSANTAFPFSTEGHNFNNDQYYDYVEDGWDIRSSLIDSKLKLDIGATDPLNNSNNFAKNEFIKIYAMQGKTLTSMAAVTAANSDFFGSIAGTSFSVAAGDGTDQSYLKLGALLRIIRDLLYLRDENKRSINSFDCNYNDSFCFNPSNNLVSLNPSVCLIPNSNWEWDFNRNWSDICGDNDWYYNDFKGKTLHIFVNCSFILTALDENTDEETGETNVIDFLKSILLGINNACGNVIDLNLVYESEDNIYYIIDENLSDAQVVTQFNVTSLKDSNGSFVKKINTKCQITPALATQIAIGAQASNTSTSDSLPFANWNAGLTDRIIAEKLTASSPKNSSYNEDNEFSEIYDKLIEFYFIDSDKTKELIPQYKKYMETVTRKNSPSAFIPLNLGLEMEGLSGMRLFQHYAITEKYLPQNYRENIIFIIKGISHNINAKEWTTTIDGLSIPKPPTTRVSSGKKKKKQTNNNNAGSATGNELQDFVENIQQQEAAKCKAAASQQSPVDRVRIVAKFFKDKGLSLNATLGILGNMLEEAGPELKPWSMESTNKTQVNKGIGLIQWSNDSKKKFVAAYNAQNTYTWCSMDFQLNYFWDTETEIIKTFKDNPNQTIAEYTEYFWAEVEKPSAFTKYAPYKTNPVSGGGFEAYRIPITNNLLYIKYAKDALEATEMATRKANFERSLNERVENANDPQYKNIVQEVYKNP